MENQFQQMTAEMLAAACDLGDEFESACAAMIRKLHAENQKLRAALEQQTAGHNQTLDELRIAEQDVRRLHAENVELRANLKRPTFAQVRNTP